MLFVSLGILFQPVAKIALGRTIWNIVDVIVGILLLALVFFEPKQPENSSDPK
jgi:arginine exporter protein ArgO